MMWTSAIRKVRQMAYDSGAEVFVRIHANGSENKKRTVP